MLENLNLIQAERLNCPLPLQAFHEEYSRLYELSQEETTPQEDARLQHALVYFFQNKAPKRIIERTLLEQFTDRNLSFDERYKQITALDEAQTSVYYIRWSFQKF